MDVISLVLSIGSALLALASVGFSVFVYNRKVVHDRRRDTLDAFNTLQEQAFDTLNDYSAEEIKSILAQRDKDGYRELSRCLARIEHFCVGVQMGIYDRETVYEMAHGYLDGALWTKLEPVLERKHEGRQEEYYANYRRVVAWMKEKSGEE